MNSSRESHSARLARKLASYKARQPELPPLRVQLQIGPSADAGPLAVCFSARAEGMLEIGIFRSLWNLLSFTHAFAH